MSGDSRLHKVERDELYELVERNPGFESYILERGGYEREVDKNVAWEAHRAMRETYLGRYRRPGDEEVHAALLAAREATYQLSLAMSRVAWNLK